MHSVTIETINENLYTIIWHKRKGWAESLDDDTYWFELATGVRVLASKWMKAHIATALPALSRYPNRDDLPFLYQYLAVGLIPILSYDSGDGEKRHVPLGIDTFIEAFIDRESGFAGRFSYHDEITHAIHNGERIEIAIKKEN